MTKRRTKRSRLEGTRGHISMRCVDKRLRELTREGPWRNKTRFELSVWERTGQHLDLRSPIGQPGMWYGRRQDGTRYLVFEPWANAE